MSTPSSPKHNRNERHLQRQRGAGARNLTTSFGFVLGLPLDLPAQQVVDQSPAIEPPTKRRKVCRENGRENDYVVDHTQVLAAKEESVRELQSKATSRSRRRFNALLEEKDKLPEVQPDESFVETRPVAKKRGRPKRACARDEFTVTDPVAIAPGLPAAVADIEDPPAPLKKKRGRPRKIASLSPNEEPLATRDQVAKTTNLPVKKRGRPRKLVATTADDAALDQTSASAKSEEPTANYSLTVPPLSQELQGEQPPKSAATGRLTARPRRQAATSAMSKMLEVFIEEELPVDSKRREPTAESIKKRQRRIAPSARASNQLKIPGSSCKIHERTVGAETGFKDSERAWQGNAASPRKPLGATEVNAVTKEMRSPEALGEECGPKHRHRKEVVRAAGKENGYGIAESRHIEPMDHLKIAAASSVTDSKRGAASDQDVAQVSGAGDEPGLDAAGSQQRNLVSTQNEKALTANASKKKSSLPRAASSAASGRLLSSSWEANGKRGLLYKHRSHEQHMDQGNVLQERERSSLRRATKFMRAQYSTGGDDNSEMDLDEMLSSIATYAADQHRWQAASKRNNGPHRR